MSASLEFPPSRENKIRLVLFTETGSGPYLFTDAKDPVEVLGLDGDTDCFPDSELNVVGGEAFRARTEDVTEAPAYVTRLFDNYREGRTP